MAQKKSKKPCCNGSYSNQEWIRLLKSDDRAAKDKLWKVLFCFADQLRRFKGLDEERVRNAAVDAYTRIMARGIYQYDSRGSFCGFIYTIAINEIYRRSIEPDPDPIDENIEEHIAGEDEERAPPDWDKLLQALRECLEELEQQNKRRHQAVQMHYFEGLNYYTIATHMDISPNNTRSLSFHGRQTLRECLERKGFDANAVL